MRAPTTCQAALRVVWAMMVPNPSVHLTPHQEALPTLGVQNRQQGRGLGGTRCSRSELGDSRTQV